MKTAQELRELVAAEQLEGLHKEAATLRRELFELRVGAVSSHVRDYASRRRALKAAIARTLTIASEHWRQVEIERFKAFLAGLDAAMAGDHGEEKTDGA